MLKKLNILVSFAFLYMFFYGALCFSLAGIVGVMIGSLFILGGCIVGVHLNSKSKPIINNQRKKEVKI